MQLKMDWVGYTWQGLDGLDGTQMQLNGIDRIPGHWKDCMAHPCN